jgi:hypothetical protein
VYDPRSTNGPPDEKHPTFTIVFNGTAHDPCAFVFAAYSMRSDVTIAARNIVDIVDEERYAVEDSVRFRAGERER